MESIQTGILDGFVVDWPRNQSLRELDGLVWYFIGFTTLWSGLFLFRDRAFLDN